jgi:NADP-dependent 3-hydroxy acid dehydrogenase YdfG
LEFWSVSPGRVNTGILTNNDYDMNSTIVQRMVKSPGLNAENVADSILHVLSTSPHVQV